MFLGLIFQRRMRKYTPKLSNMVPTMCLNRINIHMNYMMCYRNNRLTMDGLAAVRHQDDKNARTQPMHIKRH